MIVKRRAIYDNVLSIPAGLSGAFAVEHVEQPTGHVFRLANARTAILGGHVGGKVVYDRPTTWRRLTESGVVWMSDYPIEQAQHDRELATIRRGRVLVGGLGLGYAATVLARRPGVAEVVVVEKSPEVVELVAPHLVQDDSAARRKLTVVRADLFEYLGDLPARIRFEHAFYDIWASDGEATFFEVVVPLLRLSRGRVRRTPACWNESVMRGQLYDSISSQWASLMMMPSGNGTPTLDELCDASGSVWRDWTVPFFRWVRREGPDRATVEEKATLYAGCYGRSSFSAVWQVVAGEDVPDLEVRR